MSFIQLKGLNDVRAPEIHPEGRVPLCIVDAKVVEKDGKIGIRCMLEIEEPHPDPGQSWNIVFHHISPPGGDDDEAKADAKLRMAKQFFVQFGIPYDDGVDVESFKGCRADGNLIIDEYNNQSNNKLKCDPLPKGE